MSKYCEFSHKWVPIVFLMMTCCLVYIEMIKISAYLNDFVIHTSCNRLKEEYSQDFL